MTIESIIWRNVESELPDKIRTVLVYGPSLDLPEFDIREPDKRKHVWMAWYSRTAAVWTFVDALQADPGVITHWAELPTGADPR
jgi:hypothetical protein